MIGQIIVQAYGGLVQAGLNGFLTDRIQQNRILFLEVPNTGKGVDTPSFSLIASGNYSGIGTWNFAINLGLTPANQFAPPMGAVIASYSQVQADSAQHGYVFEADISVVNGVPQTTSPWTLTIDGTVVASGTCNNFPTVPWAVGPSNGQGTVSMVSTRTVSFSFNAAYVGSATNSAIGTIKVSEAGYPPNNPIVTINNLRNWITPIP